MPTKKIEIKGASSESSLEKLEDTLVLCSAFQKNEHLKIAPIDTQKFVIRGGRGPISFFWEYAYDGQLSVWASHGPDCKPPIRGGVHLVIPPVIKEEKGDSMVDKLIRNTKIIKIKGNQRIVVMPPLLSPEALAVYFYKLVQIRDGKGSLDNALYLTRQYLMSTREQQVTFDKDQNREDYVKTAVDQASRLLFSSMQKCPYLWGLM